MTGIEWAAGLYEGEGTIYLNRGSPCINLRMTNKEAVEKFQGAVGIGKVYGPYKWKGHYKPLYCFQIDKASDTIKVAEAIYPHLTKERQEQMEAVISAYDEDWWP
jgi:hypothetical protein